MPVFPSHTESAMSAIRSRFGFGQTHHPEPADSSTAIIKSSASSPDLLMKSVRRGNSASDDGETTSVVASRSFEFGLDPNFWKEHNVQVIIRLRPLSSSEISVQGPSRCVKQESSQTITWTGHPESRFTFDIVADESVSQEMLFKVAGVPMVENCMLGYNSCMFAYGQTGSGKTHTMLGDIEGGTRRHSVNCGMTPRVFEFLFSRIQKEKDARREEKVKFTCRCSFIEIYNEQILDLLDPSSANLQIREDTNKGIYVENVTEVEVTSARDVIQHLIQGSTNRKVAATNMNHASSRSHSVFTCVIESKWESEGVTHHRFARLNLVDLAGSERQKSSGAEGERLREATNINKSLSTLGLVIMNLVSISNGRTPHVPYRDSKLTFLLQDSLGGNAKTIIIANISPSSSCSLETLSTLKFAQRAKFIKNHAIVNEDASGDVLALRLENQNLKNEVSHLRSLVHGGAEIGGDNLSITFPGSPGTFKWDGQQGFSSPIVSHKKMSHKKEYEVALVGALQRENDKDTALQALAAENQAALRLAKQREDEIQGLKMRLRFREAGIKRLESVASGKMSAETHLLQEREEHLKEIEVFRAQVERNQDVTRFAMENLRLKEEIRRLKSFCEEGEQERLTEQISILEKELREALDWKLMHESDCAITQKESRDLVVGTPTDSNFLTSNQECTSPWRTSMSEENEFLRMQAIQNQSEIDGLHRKIDFLVDQKEKLEMHINDLVKELEAERLSKEAIIANEAQKQETKISSVVNTGVSDQTELKTMVEAIGAASEREAEAHEVAILLSKENDELKTKLKVLIEDNNKLIDLYERAGTESRNKSSDSSEIPCLEDHDDGIAKADDAKRVEIEKEFEKLNCQLTEMHEENDKLLSLYEKAMLERDELKKVIASGQNKNAGNKGNDVCPEKLVEIDEVQCLSFGEAFDCFENEHVAEEMSSSRLNVDDVDTDVDVQSCLYEVHVEDDCNLYSIDSPVHNYSDANEANMDSFAEVGKTDVAEQMEQNAMEIDEPIKFEELDESCATIPMHVCEDLKSIRMKLAEARNKLSDSAETVSIFGSFERAIVDVDALSEKIDKLECSKEAKKQECQHLQVLSSELHERKELANNKLLALKHSLTNFSSSLSYFEQREAVARSRLDDSSQHLIQKKEELISLQSSRQELVLSLSKMKHTENELRSTVENLRMKLEEENQKLESDRVLFAIDNVAKPAATDLCNNKSWQVTGKATALLKSEEEKTKLQNQIKLNREKLGDVRKQSEAINKKLAKLVSEIPMLEAEVEKEMRAVEEMNAKAEHSLQEKEMLQEVKENGKHEFENMLLEYHQRLFEAGLKDEEVKMVQEEVIREAREVDSLQIAKVEVAFRKKQFVEAMSSDDNTCFVSDKVEAALHSLHTSVEELSLLLQHFG